MPKSVPAPDFTIGWVCALPIELAAAVEMMDEEFDELPSQPTGSNIYSFGRIGSHNVVAASLPAGRKGMIQAAAVASHMRTSFPSLRFGVLVGIGGGVPVEQKIDIRLGDVVFSQPTGQHGGVIQYDFGKTGADGDISRTGSLNAPPEVLLNALAKLQVNSLRHKTQVRSYLSKLSAKPNFASPGPDKDILYRASSQHVTGATCAKCNPEDILHRDARTTTDPVLFFGNIASGNQVMKDGPTRDRYSQELGGVLCFEMEAAGLMNNFPCIVIRGICNYADAHKNDQWQSYAAATAAACAKELLRTVPPLVTSSELHREAVAKRHPETIREMICLASTYSSQEVLKLRKVVLGVKHPDTIGSMIELAATYQARGKHAEAVEMKNEALKLRREVFGMRHASTIWAMAHLAAAYSSQGKHSEAEKMYKEVLGLRKEVLRAKHPDTIKSLIELATTYETQGKYAEAEEMKIEALELRQEVFGMRHASTIWAMAHLAATYTKQGKHSEAEKIHKEVLGLRKEVLWAKHPDTIKSLIELARSYQAQGKHNEAERFYEEGLGLRKEVLGAKHPDTIRVMSELAKTYQAQGMYSKAETMNIEVLKLREESQQYC
ncbi:phosphorylase superfamily protein [Colletotrichum higginsianum]|nr:phosphorylase superfamily protein [Colletotrichum higginsianum]